MKECLINQYYRIYRPQANTPIQSQKASATTATRFRLCTHSRPKPPKLAPNGPYPSEKAEKRPYSIPMQLLHDPFFISITAESEEKVYVHAMLQKKPQISNTSREGYYNYMKRRKWVFSEESRILERPMVRRHRSRDPRAWAPTILSCPHPICCAANAMTTSFLLRHPHFGLCLSLGCL